MPRKSRPTSPRRICFVTGTRAEFGLMRSVLLAIQNHARLKLQIVVTGMHLDARHGMTLKDLEESWKIHAVVPWLTRRLPPLPVLRERAGVRVHSFRAVATGLAIASLAETFTKLKPDIVLIVGDRVEAFAAAAAAHLCDIPVAHVHGGDRAMGQADDALRHAITKLSHIHFPATAQSAGRIRKLGEDRRRIHRVGSPGIEGIRNVAADGSQIRKEFPGLKPRRFALLILHPVDARESVEFNRAAMTLRALATVGFERIIIIYPNNDPGSGGIIRAWRKLAGGQRFIVRKNLPRPILLGLLRDAALLAGNSSSGIIEAASFGTPVIDIGPRQLGRERNANVRNVPYRQSAIQSAAKRIWNGGRPRRYPPINLYGGTATGRKIAAILAETKLDTRLLRKVIGY